MLKINRQTDYAVRVILSLAKREGGTRLSSAVIRREMQIPPAFMGRIVAQLAQAELIITYPGREGGIMLARPPREITLRDVVEAFEGKFCISACLDGGIVDCPFEAACPVRKRWGKLQVVILQELSKTTFEALANEGAVAPV